MTTSQQLKRFRLRFSIRTLAIVVTLVCCYAACWGPTKTRGVEDVNLVVPHNDFFSPSRLASYLCAPRAIAPLVVTARANDNLSVDLYYFWFFGYVAKLPYEREVDSTRVTGGFFDEYPTEDFDFQFSNDSFGASNN